MEVDHKQKSRSDGLLGLGACSLKSWSCNLSCSFNSQENYNETHKGTLRQWFKPEIQKAVDNKKDVDNNWAHWSVQAESQLAQSIQFALDSSLLWWSLANQWLERIQGLHWAKETCTVNDDKRRNLLTCNPLKRIEGSGTFMKIWLAGIELRVIN